MHTNKAQNEKKRIFLQNNMVLAKAVLRVHPASMRVHRTPNGKLFVAKARTELGYSAKTYDGDILSSMSKTFQELTGFSHYETNHLEIH